ncbi:MAG: response regulator [Chitinivibrionales bacterium]
MHPKIVVVDGDSLRRALLATFLHQQGYEHLELFAHSQDAFEYVRSIWTDLIITDYHMREYTGVQLIRRISRYRPDVPAILVAGSGIRIPANNHFVVVRRDVSDYHERLISHINLGLRKSCYGYAVSGANCGKIRHTESAAVLS